MAKHKMYMKEDTMYMKKGEKDFKDKHVVKKSGEKEDGTVMKEEVDEEEEEQPEQNAEN